MAITKEIVEDKHEIVTEYKHIQIRTATIIKEDGVEISRTYHRHVVTPDMDASNESDEVKKLVGLYHTDEMKKSWSDFKKALADAGP